MGLTIIVGCLADLVEHDEEGAAWHRKVLEDLNVVLAESGELPHHEPEQIQGGSRSWDSFGYSGLHHVRRLAAWLSINLQLPPPCPYERAAKDPVLSKFYEEHDHFLRHGPRKGILGFLRREQPAYQHLMLHSDCEGFYLPRALPNVVFDRQSPQRDGIGAMIGSADQLLEECRQLAQALAMPADIDPEADELYENLETPPTEGEAWQRLPVETFVLTRLIAACELSLKSGSAVVFA